MNTTVSLPSSALFSLSPLGLVPLGLVPLEAGPLEAGPLEAVPLEAGPLEAEPLETTSLETIKNPACSMALFTDFSTAASMAFFRPSGSSPPSMALFSDFSTAFSMTSSMLHARSAVALALGLVTMAMN